MKRVANGPGGEHRVVLASCEGGQCPTIYDGDDDGVIVQGYLPGASGETAEGEVWIPKKLLRRAARSI